MRIVHCMLFLSLLLLSACDSPQKTVRPVIVEAVEVSKLAQVVGYSGALHARVEAALSFRVAGKVVERLVDLGDRVEKGQLLLRLDDSDMQLQVEAASAKVRAAAEQHQLAKLQYDRAQSLQQKHLISRSAFDQRKAQVDVAAAQLKQAKKQLAVQKNRLRYTQLRASHAGVITRVLVAPGQVVMAGEAVVGFARLGRRDFIVAVSGGRVGDIEKNDKVSVRFWARPQERVAGKVYRVARAADPHSGTYAIRINLPDAPDWLRLGMQGRAFFSQQRQQPSIQLPATSLYHQGRSAAVWVVNQKQRLELRRVKPLSYTDTQVILAANGALKAGDLVVTRGVSKLHEGLKVKPLDAFFKQPTAESAH